MRVGGTVRVPGDKSISHRALILGSLATGTSHVRGILQSADIHSTAAALRLLGVGIPPLSDDMTIRGVGLHGFHAPDAPIDCGNSGTTARLMAGVVAASPFGTRFVGDESLSRRPMRRVSDPLTAMGASVAFDRGTGTLPMTIRGGPLRSIAWRSETASAQTKSAILLAGLVGGVAVSVLEPHPSRDHTERMLSSLGVRIVGTLEVDGHRVALSPSETLSPFELGVPGDPSSAAFFAAVGALATAGEIELPDVLVNPTRTGFIDALRAMGASIEQESDAQSTGGERVGRLRVRAGELHGISLGADQVPAMIDELPLLACVASRARGETVITGAAELRVKESDRIATVVGNLRALGVEAAELPDGMRIVGARAPLRGSIRTHGDHRIAMAFGVLAVLDGSAIEIDDRDCVAVSYPDFWDDLRRVVA